ncbi:MAG: pantoate--beta-alanine ligase [Acidimicrobiia bacterium]
MEIVTTFADVRAAARGGVGLVPTMGFLHEGHLALAAAGRPLCDTLVMSLFVNPLQFGRGEDLETYPRDLPRDAALAADAGVDVLFAPAVDEMYPDSPATTVTVADLAAPMEGRFRPGHFEGVAMAVVKLFAGIEPRRAFFGRKDAQQLALVTRVASDLSFPVEVVGVSTVREMDGLALSSRNTYLDPSSRRAALSLSGGLFAAADAAEAGEVGGAALEQLVAAELAAAGLVPDYVELVDRADVQRLAELDRHAFLAVAAAVGPARLIDNVHFDVADDGSVRADRGVLLEAPSAVATDSAA